MSARRGGGGEEGSSESGSDSRGEDDSDSSEVEAVSDGDLSEELLCACQEGELRKVRYLVEERHHVDPQSFHDTALHLASTFGHLPIVRYLVEERNCDVECRDKNGNTPLHCAACGGNLEIIQYLIRERGCDPMCRDLSSSTPLHCACAEGRLDMVRYLVEEVKVDPSCPNEYDITPLHVAAEFGELVVTKYMVENTNCDVECRDKNRNTPLHCAASEGRLDIIQYLIRERGCDPMCRDSRSSTPLHCACGRDNYKGDSLDVVRYLVEEVKVDPSCTDQCDVTPLHMASSNGHLQVVKLLVEECLCDPAVRDCNGDSASDCAQREGYTHITDYLSSVEKVVSTDLRRALVAQLKPYTRKARPTGVELGSGTYGSVVELVSAKEIVAGKVFRISSTQRLLALTTKVCGELILIAQLHHPHIVRFKGVCLLPDQTLPVLLMERLMSSLHAYILAPGRCSLSVERKVSILCDVACGLSFLHSQTPAIIHRDLTAKNVLLDSELTTKIADFGNARIMDLDPETSPETFTCVPGTLEYMPPEAQGGGSQYDTSLDVFSFGHLSLFTVTEAPVRPLLPATYCDPQGDKVHARSEVKRREHFVEKADQLLSEKLPLAVLIKQCLHNNPAQRPHTEQLLARLQEMDTPVERAPETLERCRERESEEAIPAAKRSKMESVANQYTAYPQTASVQSTSPSAGPQVKGGDTPASYGVSASSTSSALGQGSTSILDKKPTMSELSHLKKKNEVSIPIKKRIGIYYEDLGYDLLNDDDGAITKQISDEYHSNGQRIVGQIFQRWLQGQGRHPVTWRTLIEVLRNIELSVLATDIESCLCPDGLP